MAKRVRLSPDARRAQLIDLGVRMLATRTLEDLSVEALAEQAGISRGLLFHYFRSKQEFHLEVIRASAHELLERTAPDDSLAPHEQLRTSLSAFIDYVTENRDAYIALVRGAASGDETVRQVFDDPEGDHDWGITAIVDLDASDELGSAVVHVTHVGPHSAV